jgi:hypothetical protein
MIAETMRKAHHRIGGTIIGHPFLSSETATLLNESFDDPTVSQFDGGGDQRTIHELVGKGELYRH